VIFETESGSRYEIADGRGRKLVGGHTEMTDGGGWRTLREWYVVEGLPALLVWDEPGHEFGLRGTETSRVVGVYHDGGES
jgi:hypothetical protein